MKIIVLVDDDNLIRLSWKLHFKGNRDTFYSFSSLEQAPLESLPKDTYFFLDSDLGGGVKGEIIGENLHKKGFSNLYLVTGFSKTSFNLQLIPWIKDVLGKLPPDLDQLK